VTDQKAQQSAATREEIISSCLSLFAHRGFHITSISEIAKRAGITKGAIYWHFTNKEALFEAILDRIKHDWQTTVMLHVEEAAGARLKFEKLFDNYFLLFDKQPEVCLFLQRVMLRGTEDKYTQLVNGVFERTTKFIAKIIQQGKREGLFRSDVDARLLSYAIIGALAGATSHCYANKKLKLQDLIDQIKQQALSRVLV